MTQAVAQDGSAEVGKTELARQQAVRQGVDYLRNHGQADDGSFTAQAGPGLTSLALTAAMRNGLTPDDPMVSKGLKALEGFVKPDGGIYGSGRLKNYETCISMICFAEANKTGKYNDVLKRAKEFVTRMQYGAAGDDAEAWYGGSGYSSEGRPDLSNTSYTIEALRAAEAAPNDPAIQRALAFVSRCQNLDGKFNDTQFAKLVNDGGFYYEIPKTAIDPSESPERFTPNGGLRSYGSMSYAGLKSMIYAGLTPNDPRVKAANQWIKMHYAVDENPGMGSGGLYYYYHTFAAALDVAGVGQVTDEDGKTHDWRADLVAELAKRQSKDGAWANDNRRWFENDKNLATSFALLALAHCGPQPAATQPAADGPQPAKNP
ncbi:MAG: terpene cyclase/mutase family protein [Planctomycetales bacterium]|nr:terpene cyclase/mutase family protein [Planctomycetales bacterium]